MLNNPLAYIGPGLGLGTIVLVFIILGIVLISLGLIIWIYIKRFFEKSKQNND